jgi:hypothetical protein
MRVLAAKLTGMADATDLEATARYKGCGHATRKRKIMDKRGKMLEIEVTVADRKLISLMDAATKLPLAGKAVLIQEHEVLSMRALVTEAWTNLAGHARLHKVAFIRDF